VLPFYGETQGNIKIPHNNGHTKIHLFALWWSSISSSGLGFFHRSLFIAGAFTAGFTATVISFGRVSS